jgi:hypothetical protein
MQTPGQPILAVPHPSEALAALALIAPGHAGEEDCSRLSRSHWNTVWLFQQLLVENHVQVAMSPPDTELCDW